MCPESLKSKSATVAMNFLIMLMERKHVLLEATLAFQHFGGS